MRRGRRWRWHYDPAHHALRFFVRRSMQRTIFAWFGVTIIVTGVVVFTIARSMHLAGFFDERHPPPARAFTALLVGMLLVWGASGFLARRLSQPITDLVRAAEAFGSGNLDARVGTRPHRHGHPRDTFVVASAFNAMAQRIQQQISDQRTLLAAVSHELRTPLARMAFLTERARRGDADALASIEDEIRGIDALVGDLLANARIDFSARNRSWVDASDVALRALEATGEDPAKLVVVTKRSFHADATLVVRALVNLIENARRHGGGLVELTVDATDGTVAFVVDDDGEGFAAGEEERVFDAFYNNPKSPEAKQKSAGLGLALVRRIAHWHGGVTRAENRAPRGARFILTLPEASERRETTRGPGEGPERDSPPSARGR